MQTDCFTEIRQDCLLASSSQPDVIAGLSFKHIAVTGGTGFLGTWIAEMVAAVNDEHRAGITLDLYARSTSDWLKKYPHLASRGDVNLKSQDVRSGFDLAHNTHFVIHAAGIPNNRVHSSDPLRVHQTTILGLNHALEAASKLDNLTRFLNVSSCLVNGRPTRSGALSEADCFPISAGQLHTVYVEAKRAAENLASIYRSQFRMPVSTIRPFTFAGAFQELDRPWAINNFMRDLLTSNELRVHGDGSARRSYLYGSDAAWWTLAALVKGVDGATYNVGSPAAVTHFDLANLISERVSQHPRVVLNTAPSKHTQQDDLFPDLTLIQKSLGVVQTCCLEQTIDKTWRWYSSARR